jgi:hypothetical protein
MAGPNFVWLWVPVLRRTALDDIGDIDLFSLKMDRLDDFGQELPCLSDKRPPLKVFIVSRPFTDDHQLRPFIPLPDNNAPAGPLEFTPSAIPQIRSNLFQGPRPRGGRWRIGQALFRMIFGGDREVLDPQFLQIFQVRLQIS